METKEIDKDVAEQTHDEQKKPVYVSRNGFEIVPIYRGFYEIKKVFEIVHPLGAVICGGYARYCASNHKNPLIGADVDIYCPDDEVFEKLEAIFVNEHKLEVKHENEMALTFKKTTEGYLAHTPVLQLIKPVKEGRVVAVGSMEDILSNFDFTVVRAAILNDQECMVDADFLHDEERRILRLKNIHCPISSTLRCMKYASKGYWLPPFQCLSLFTDWDARTDEYKQKLYEFLDEAQDGEGLSKEQVEELEKMMRID
jgi:hypothetical protein